jgi:hypothetical protein
MAGRGGAGVGMIVTVSVLGVLTLALFVFTFVFYGKFQNEKRDHEDYKNQVTNFIRPDEQQRDDIRSIADAARQAGNKSVVGYLVDSTQRTMRRVSGSPSETVTTLEDKLANIPGADGSSLLQVVQDMQGKVSQLEGQLTQADADRRRALEDLANESERVAKMQESHNAGCLRLAQRRDRHLQVGGRFQYRDGINDTRKDMDARVERLLAPISRDTGGAALRAHPPAAGSEPGSPEPGRSASGREEQGHPQARGRVSPSWTARSPASTAAPTSVYINLGRAAEGAALA